MNSAPTLKESFLAKQDPKTGVSSELLRVLAKLEVDRMTDAVQREQAIQQGQPQGQPTVADTAGQKAEQFMQQQLVQQFAQNHPAQSQQQQAQAPGGLQAAAQVQGAAEGGLTKLQTNLPTKYAGGGIVSFNGEEDSYVSIPGLVAGTSYQDAIREAEKAKDSKYLQDMDKVAEFLGVVPKAVLSPIAQALASPVESFKKMVSAPGYGINSPKEKEKEKETPYYGNEQRHSLASPAGSSLASSVQQGRRGSTANPGSTATTANPGSTATAAPSSMDEFERVMREEYLSEAKRGRNVDRDEAIENAKRLYGNKVDASVTGLRALLAEMDKKHTDAADGRSGWRDFINDAARGTMGAKKGDWAGAVLGTVLAGEQRKEGYSKADKEHLLDKLKLQQGIDTIDIGAGEKMSAEAARAQSDARADRRATLTGMHSVYATDENIAGRKELAKINADARMDQIRANRERAYARAKEHGDTKSIALLGTIENRLAADAQKEVELMLEAHKNNSKTMTQPFDAPAAKRKLLLQKMGESKALRKIYEDLGLPMDEEGAGTGGNGMPTAAAAMAELARRTKG